MCTGTTSSHVNYNGQSESLIDHILLPIEKVDLVSDCSILDDDALNVSNHRPVVCTLNFPLMNVNDNGSGDSSFNINWRNVRGETLANYKEYCLVDESLKCLSHVDVDSKQCVDFLHDGIVSSIRRISEDCIPKSDFKHFLKPYWNKELKAAHKYMKRKRWQWKVDDKPRGERFQSYIEYKSAKCEFRKLHRCVVEQYLINLNSEIDNSRKKSSNSAPGSEIKFNGVTYRDPKDKLSTGEVILKIYTPVDNALFSNSITQSKNREFEAIKTSLSNIPYNDVPNVSYDELNAACKRAKRNKACGIDSIYYEHIIFGGDVLISLIAKLFSCMIKFAHTPIKMKKGVIITLFKGGNKDKTDPNSYRAITLSSVLLKLFESILLNRLEGEGSYDNINAMQGGFQRGLGCMMTSFTFRECCSYTYENRSQLNIAFLDVRRAFDTVWHVSLFLMLSKFGLKSYILKSIIDLYENMSSCVRNQGHYSSWFDVLQGTRQGGVLSPFLYIVFINELMDKLKCSNQGLCVYGLNCACPTSADDMVLLSLSKVGLNKMVDLCYQYGIENQYFYNHSKCSIIVTGESSYSYKNRNRSWFLGVNAIEEDVEYKHLGILFNKFQNTNTVINEACSKLRSTFLSIINCGIYYGGIHPSSSKTIYKTIVLPKALYGCELWGNIC